MADRPDIPLPPRSPSDGTRGAAARRSRLFYGWWVVVGAFILQALSAGMLAQAFGTYFVHLQDEFGWSRALLSGAFSMAQLESGFFGPVQGWLLARFGPRAIIRVGVVIFAAGMMLLSRTDSVLTFYVAFLVASIGSGLAGFLSVSVALANWFDRKRATAMGLAATGWGAAGLMIPGVAWSLNTIGWRETALISGFLVLFIGLPVAQLIRHAPEPYGYAPDGASRDAGGLRAGTEPPGSEQDFTLVEALRTPVFWLLAAGHAAAWLLSSAVMVHLVPHLHDGAGMSLEAAAGIVTLLTIFVVVGQAGGGLLGDRVDKRSVLAVCMVGHMVGLLALAVARGPLLVFAFTAIHGLSWGIRGSLITPIRADYFGRTSFPTITGFASLVVTFGGILGPIFAGLMADRLGDYRLGFVILALVAGAGTVFFAAARRPAAPRGTGRAAAPATAR